MDKLEKALRGLECCLPETLEDADMGCEKCPYFQVCEDGAFVTLNAALVEDIRAALRTALEGGAHEHHRAH